MLTMIFGGSGSGKSLFAEHYTKCFHVKQNRDEKASNLYYLATMMPYGKETEKKIKKHKKQREGKEFIAIEQYLDIDQSFENTCFYLLNSKESENNDNGNDDASAHKNDDIYDNAEKPIVLLECLSNLVANELYEERRKKEWKQNQENQKKRWEIAVANKVIGDIEQLKKQCQHIVIVTNDVFREGFGEWEGTKEYLSCLGKINEELAKQADTIYEVVASIPILIKGEETLEWIQEVEDKKGMGKIVLILGGAFQGKRKWAMEQYQGYTLREHLEEWMKEEIEVEWERCQEKKKEIDEVDIVHKLWEKIENIWIQEENSIFLVNEIGAGMVPMGKKERLYREVSGRISCELAKRADEVYRIIAGCPMKLKGK